MSFNKITVLGNLTRDPELRYTPQGTPVCVINLASNDRERDQRTKELVDRATFFRATIWGKNGETIAQHFERGSEIYLEGKFKPEEWTDREGARRVTYGIQVSDFNFTGGSKRDFTRTSNPAIQSVDAGNIPPQNDESETHETDDIDFS